MVLNPKIVKVIAAIDKTKEQIAELQAKQRELEKQKTQLENDEIIAMFRRERFNEDEFAALLQAGRQKGAQTSSSQESQPRATPQDITENRKEDGLDDIDEA